MDILPAAAQYFGVGARWAFAISIVVSGAAFVVMRLYTRAITRESRRGAAPPRPELRVAERRGPASPAAGPLELCVETPGHAALSSRRSPTFKHAREAFRRAAWCYVLAGSLHAAASTALLFGFGFYASPVTSSPLTLIACYAGIFWGWFFVTVVALALFVGPQRRLRMMFIAGYAGMLPLLGVLLAVAGAPPLPFADVGLIDPELQDLMVSMTRAMIGEAVDPASVVFSPFTQPTLFLTLTAAPLMIPVLAFNRFVRATVGPVFVTFALVLMLGCIVFLDLIVWMAPQTIGTALKRLLGDATLRVLVGFSLAAAAAAACLVLLWVTRRYRRTQLGDQTFLFDALWLSVSVWLSAYLMAQETPFVYLLGLVPFALSKLVQRFGLSRFVSSAEPLPNARLLFLRVFGSARRSEKLFDLLAARWRYAGSVQLISATDVARSRFEPDEFLDFIGGRFAARYISGSDELDRRIAQLELRPDPDGRYRVNEFFCRDDTWQQTVVTLIRYSDLVVMDLRGFTAERRGCIFELSALIDTLALERVVLLTDRTTDMALLRQTIAGLWETMDTRSPNAGSDSGKLRVIELQRGYARAVRRIMEIGDGVMLGAHDLRGTSSAGVRHGTSSAS
jgi:hypothetical protein